MLRAGNAEAGMVLDLLGPRRQTSKQYDTGSTPSWGRTVLEHVGGQPNPDLGAQQGLPGGSGDCLRWKHKREFTQ